jgi:hypothetical protein
MGITSSLRKLARAANAADINKIAKELKADPNIENALIDEVAESAKQSLRGKRVQFKKDYTVEEATRTGRSGFSDKAEYEVERGMAGEVTEGNRSMPRMDEAASKGSRKRSKKVAELETKAEKGVITEKEQVELDRLNALSAEQDMSRSRKAAATKSTTARKDRGISLMGMEGIERVGAKPKIKQSDVYIGNTTNGITPDGEIIGSPTANQIKTAMRDFDSRARSAAKNKLIRDIKDFLKRMRGPNATPAQRKAANEVEKLYNQFRGAKSTASQQARVERTRRLSQDTPQNKTTRQREASASFNRSKNKGAREMSRGGAVRKGHTDMRGKGIFYK